MSTTWPEITWRRPALRCRISGLDARRLRAAAPLLGLLAPTAALYLWALSRNGWSNQYYAAAVQAGTHSWKAFLFGSIDASNFITVDKPPASLWLMELSGRIFGFSSFSMLLPQALEGVAAVGLVYASVRRWFGRPAGLLSGLLLAITPVAALMFRFNNSDALLVLLLVLAAYALTRALEKGSARWLLLTGTSVGFAFLTKELEAFLVLPGFALVYLVAAPVPLRRRVGHLVLAGGALVASAGWWVVLVELWPAGSRPYLGDSTSNSILQLIFSSNGLDRLSGAAGPGGGFGGSAGLLRLFNSQLGGQISWLLPAAAIALVSGAAWTFRRPRGDRCRPALMLWGGWLILVGGVFSFMTGVIHPYYATLLAPAIAVLVGTGAVALWRRREQLTARLILAAMLLSTAGWSFTLLGRSPHWHAWLRFAVLLGGVAAAAGVLAAPRLGAGTRRAVTVAGLVVALAAPSAYPLNVPATGQTGANPSAGPAVAGSGFGAGRAPGEGAPGTSITSRALALLLAANSSRYTWIAATSSSQNGASIELATGKAVMAIGGFGGRDPSLTLARFKQLVARGKIHYYVAGGGGPGGGAPGGFPDGPPPGLAGQGPTGGGPPPGGFGGPGGPAGPGGQGGESVASQIESWVSGRFKSTTVGGSTVYDLTQAASGAAT